jgi:hypothetical protein
MVTYNESGQRFYMKNGFRIVNKLNNYYDIEGKSYDAFLFTFMTNGAIPKRDWMEVLNDLVGCFKRLCNFCDKRKKKN